MFNTMLTEGRTYIIHSVRFQSQNMFMSRNLNKPFECYFDHNTIVEAYVMSIQFPRYPRHLASFDEVARPPSDTFFYGKFGLRVTNLIWACVFISRD